VNWVEDLHMDPEAEFWIETNLRVAVILVDCVPTLVDSIRH
jgi:hypothetical protein